MLLPKTRNLARHWRSIPLLQLTQGSSLSIRSTLAQPTNIIIQSGWRDVGHAEFTQKFAKNHLSEELCDVIVTHEANRLTSLGRAANHISILIQQSMDDCIRQTGSRNTQNTVVPSVPTQQKENFVLDDETVSTVQPKLVDSFRRIEYHDDITHLSSDQLDENEILPGINLIVQVPEKLNLEVLLSEGGGNIAVEGKLEGDCSLSTTDGDIFVTRLRGHELHLTASKTVYAKELLEAQNLKVITSGRVRAKQIHGRSVQVTVDKSKPFVDSSCIPESDIDDEGSIVDISSLFISGDGGATILVNGRDYQLEKRVVRIKSHHGPLQVLLDGCKRPNNCRDDGSLYPLLELGGVNGSTQVSIGNSPVTPIYDGKDRWIACQCHVDSLSEDSVSLLSVDRGDIQLTLDRKVESDLRLASLTTRTCIDEVAALLADEEDDEILERVLSNIPDDVTKTCEQAENSVAIDTDAYTSQSSLSTKSLRYECGWVENTSNEPDSRFELKRQGSVGKIRIATAADHALQGFSSNESSNSMIHGRPLIAAVTTGQITAETVSWIGAIARRYGLVEDGHELGRTSGRHGRNIIPKEQ
ncbi:hypothetical protein MPSEU_000505900 [Mayamaea pseudoterrestris]|nr:hypothetical protein MPSEU_000505900 [Mayamaea pseudoterrestris]